MDSHENERFIADRERAEFLARSPQPIRVADYNYPLPELVPKVPPQLPDVPVTNTHPFKLVDASNPSDGVRVQVVYGTVNDMDPTGMSAGTPYYIGVSGSGVVWLKATFDPDTNEVTDVELDSGASIPANTDTEAHRQVGTYDEDDDRSNPTQDISGSQTVKRCRNWFVTPTTFAYDWILT